MPNPDVSQVSEAPGKCHHKAIFLSPLEHFSVMIHEGHWGAFPLVTGEDYVHTARGARVLPHSGVDCYQVRKQGLSSVVHSRSSKLQCVKNIKAFFFYCLKPKLKVITLGNSQTQIYSNAFLKNGFSIMKNGI